MQPDFRGERAIILERKVTALAALAAWMLAGLLAGCQSGGVEGDECLPDSCFGHGSCDDSAGSTSCACDEGYAGSRCAGCATGYQDNDGDGTCELIEMAPDFAMEDINPTSLTYQQERRLSDEQGKVILIYFAAFG